jgi:hypothetical protein
MPSLANNKPTTLRPITRFFPLFLSRLILAAGLLVAGGLHAQPTIGDIGPNPPTPGPDDQSQLTVGGGNPDGLNYYFDNGTPPGQTFTTGSNPGGYTLNTLSLGTAGGSGQLSPNGQAYVLRLYQMANGTNATLIATYTSQGAFTFTDNDWLQWTNLGAPLSPNTIYAYSFGRISTGAGWENMGNVSGDLYAGGQVALIPTAGGTVTFGASGGFDASFDIGLSQVTTLQVAAPTFAPSSSITIGTPVTVSATVVGPGPLTYQWQTDGGGGGTPTNILGATSATLNVDTTPFTTGFYQYDLVVSNGVSVVTSAPATLIVSAVIAPVGATLTDMGLNISSSIDDISQLTGNSGGSYDGLNYYDDNGANHDSWAGQTFTTGTNGQGYYISSVAIQTGGGGFNSTTVAQPYHLYLFQVESNSAAVIAHYTNASFSFTFGDWVQWGGFSQILKPNTTYAYGFGRATNGTGWAALNSSAASTDLYPGGQICAIPAEGGAVTYGQSGNEDGVFDVALLAIGVGPSPLPFAQPITVAPAVVFTAGTVLSLTETTTNGATPRHYQWLTDGGSGGALTNIPNTDVTNLSINTTGWTPSNYRYQVIVNNSYGTSTSAVSSVTVVYANTTATLSDVGATLPAPLAGDISQLTPAAGANNPDGLNYYFDNATPPGQTFTTGSNPGGYNLTSVAIDMAGNNGSLPADGQTYTLRIYSITGTNSVIYASYTSQTNSFVTTDWLRWSGFAVPLAANSTYAYSFARSASGSGWDNLANVTGDPYPGGEVALIPANGGSLILGASHGFDGVFNLGLAVPGRPAVSPAIISPTNSVYAGSPVTLSATATGSGTLTYQWQTDGGSGGALTNIPGATSPTLNADTTGEDGLTVAYALVVGSSSGFTTNELSVVTVNPGAAPILEGDTTPATASAFPGGSVSFTASFAGTLPMTFQWQVDKGSGPVNVPGQNSATLTLNNLQLSDAGSYSLIASNALGNAVSDPAVLTMNAVPTASSYTVNFQYLDSASGNAPATYSGPGIPGFGTGTFWNPINGPTANNGLATYTSASGLDDGGVNNLGLSMTVSTPESWDWTPSPAIALLDTALTARSTLPFSFSLPNGRYNVVIFCCNGTESTTGDGGSIITLGGQTATAVPTQDTSFVQGNNYVVFNNVIATGATLNGTISPVAGKFGSLNGAQVQYLGPDLNLTFTPVTGGNFQLQWPQGTLLESTNLTGPWITNTAASPYTVTPTGPQKFYRVKIQ